MRVICGPFRSAKHCYAIADVFDIQTGPGRGRGRGGQVGKVASGTADPWGPNAVQSIEPVLCHPIPTTSLIIWANALRVLNVWASRVF
jgi:hypothetical protein